MEAAEPLTELAVREPLLAAHERLAVERDRLGASQGMDERLHGVIIAPMH